MCVLDLEHIKTQLYITTVSSKTLIRNVKMPIFFLLKTMLISMYASVRMGKRQSNTIRANLMKIKMVTECAAIWIEFASYKYRQHWHQLIYCSEYMLTNVKVFWILSNGFARAHDLPVRLDNYICCKWFSL